MLYKNCVHYSREFADLIQKELFDLIWYRSKQKVDHPSDTKHGGHKDIMDAVVGSLYNAYTTKDIVINRDDILSLSSYNSNDRFDQLAIADVEESEFFNEFGIRKVSLADL